MTLRVKVSAGAAKQVHDAARWWAENRPAAPGAVRGDIGQALELLALQPGVGTPCVGADLQGVRRLFLGRIRYFVYYRATADTLQVLALWHASRGDEPSL
jgi:plasmid stabilization system protein ParE